MISYLSKKEKKTAKLSYAQFRKQGYTSTASRCPCILPMLRLLVLLSFFLFFLLEMQGAPAGIKQGVKSSFYAISDTENLSIFFFHLNFFK